MNMVRVVQASNIRDLEFEAGEVIKAYNGIGYTCIQVCTTAYDDDFTMTLLFKDTHRK